MRGVAAALLIWTGLAFIGWAFLILVASLSMPTCLGPIGVTPDSCREALGLPAWTAWDDFLAGPGSLAVILFAGWLVIAGVAREGKRQRGGL